MQIKICFRDEWGKEKWMFLLCTIDQAGKTVEWGESTYLIDDYFLVSKFIKSEWSGKRPVRLWKRACSVLFPKLSGTDVNYTGIRQSRVLSKHYSSCLLKKLGGMFTLLSSQVCVTKLFPHGKNTEQSCQCRTTSF